MAISLTENTSYTPFAVSFVSDQDFENYATLRRQVEGISSDCNMENVDRKLSGQAVMSHMEYMRRQLCPEIDAALLPQQLRVPAGQKLRDYTQYTIGTLHLVSEQFKQIIESVEPEVHQFWPVEMINEQGEHLAQHYIFLCMGTVDAIIHNSETDRKNPKMEGDDAYDDYYYYSRFGGRSEPRKIKKELVAGRACYRDIHWPKQEMIISDQVKALFDQHNIMILEYKFLFEEC